ncbi:MAG: hypothetical protein ACRD1E_01925, partial [Terriglobales bacterium]
MTASSTLEAVAGAAAAAGSGLDLLLAGAKLECGLADAGMDCQRVRALCQRAAAWHLGVGAAVGAAEVTAALAGLDRARVVKVREPEGPRFYALAPGGFAAAAR